MIGLGFVKGVVLGLTAGVVCGIVIKKYCKPMKNKSNPDLDNASHDIPDDEPEINK